MAEKRCNHGYLIDEPRECPDNREGTGTRIELWMPISETWISAENYHNGYQLAVRELRERNFQGAMWWHGFSWRRI